MMFSTAADVVGEGVETLNANLMQVAPIALSAGAGVLGVVIGWRMVRRLMMADSGSWRPPASSGGGSSNDFYSSRYWEDMDEEYDRRGTPESEREYGPEAYRRNGFGGS